MLVVDDLADAINDAIAATDKDGDPIATTDEMKTYAAAIIDTLMAGTVSNAVGTVIGTGTPITPATAPPLNVFVGSSSNGLMALTTTAWLSEMNTGNPDADPGMISGEASDSTGYLMASGLIAFSSITGFDTATIPPTPAPPTAGTLTSGAGTGGLISGLDGTGWSAAIIGGFPDADPGLAKDIYDAISNYIMANAEVTYASGSVVGTFAAGAGPLTLGAATGGTIA